MGNYTAGREVFCMLLELALERVEEKKKTNQQLEQQLQHQQEKEEQEKREKEREKKEKEKKKSLFGGKGGFFGWWKEEGVERGTQEEGEGLTRRRLLDSPGSVKGDIKS